jgi:hydrogenase maturation protein HypF
MAWARAINSPFTSSVGRLFDAAAALSGVAQTQDYEGHAAMRLESLSGKDEGEAHALPLRFEGGLWRGDWSVLLPMLMDERLSQARRSALFHSALADMLLAQTMQVAAEYGIRRVGLTGGVFQNRRLLEAVIQRLERTGFEVLIPEQLPVNDASISFGQIVEAQALNTPRINTLSNDDRDSQG